MTVIPDRPFSLLIKPAGSLCNLDCSYCFYLGNDEELGYDKHLSVMPDEVLERMITDYLGYGFPASVFTWQGGEPTVTGLDFFRKVVDFQMKLGKGGQSVANALQTNAVLIDAEWAEFLRDYRFLVGVSLDGPQEIHDHHRLDKGGKPTWSLVMDGIGHLNAAGTEFNTLSMITKLSQDKGREIYRWLVAQGFTHLQFIPCAEYDPATGEPAPQNVSPEGYGRFLCDIFDEWYHSGDIHRISVRTFDAIVGKLSGHHQLSLCNYGEKCNHYLVVEKDGGVYPCDFYVENKWHLGNVMERPLVEMFNSDRERSFAEIKCTYPEACKRCRHLELCRGGCPKDRLTAGGGKYGRPTFLCEGLKIFFDHTQERMQGLAAEVAARQQPPAGHPTGAAPVANGSISRNAPCPCGSGKKYKRCCLKA
jgi:uncharacterized protein